MAGWCCFDALFEVDCRGDTVVRARSPLDVPVQVREPAVQPFLGNPLLES